MSSDSLEVPTDDSRGTRLNELGNPMYVCCLVDYMCDLIHDRWICSIHIVREILI
jgi:hypothetical protein